MQLILCGIKIPAFFCWHLQAKNKNQTKTTTTKTPTANKNHLEGLFFDKTRSRVIEIMCLIQSTVLYRGLLLLPEYMLT